MQPANDQFEEVEMPEQAEQSMTVPDRAPLLSKQEEAEMLFSIKMHENQFVENNENLLDLTCQDSNPRTSRSMNYREFMEDRVVEIYGPVTIQDGYLVSYKLYKVKSKKADSEEFDTVVDRRFSDFQYLHQRLIENYGGYLVPRLPEKSVWASLNMQTPQYIRNRKYRLQKYLEKVLAHRKLRYTEEVVYFLLDPENNFSQRKGQHASHSTIQDSLYKLTTGALTSTTNFLTKYIPSTTLSTFAQRSLSTLGLGSVEQKHRPVAKMTKDDQLIMHNEIIINGLTDVLGQLKIIVQNTCEEGYCVGIFNDICGELMIQDQKRSKTGKVSREGSKMYDRISKEIDIEEQKSEGKYSKYEYLLQSYENLFEIIECCKQAIARRNSLAQYLQTLKDQQEQLEKKSRNNPRNINLDIVRSKIHQTTKKCDQFTQELLEELDVQVMMSKSMIGQFVGQLLEVRGALYGEASSY